MRCGGGCNFQICWISDWLRGKGCSPLKWNLLLWQIVTEPKGHKTYLQFEEIRGLVRWTDNYCLLQEIKRLF